MKLMNEIDKVPYPIVDGIVSFLNRNELENVFTLNHAWYSLWNDHKDDHENDRWWRFFCIATSRECGLFVPDWVTNGTSWKRFYFEDLSQLEACWGHQAQKRNSHNRKQHAIEVFARFKPKQINVVIEESKKKVVVPLHQRIALMKAASGEQITSKQAIEMMIQEGEFMFQPESPPNTTEKKMLSDFTFGIHNLDVENNEVLMMVPSTGLRAFQFNRVLDPNISQREMYETVARKSIFDCINGRNATIIAYGQTGSGKTHTMVGPLVDVYDPSNMQPFEIFRQPKADMGIIPNVCKELFNALNMRKNNTKSTNKLFASYVEIHGDQVLDLLNNAEKVVKATAVRKILDGESSIQIRSENDLIRALEKGERVKTKAATQLNHRSTRAHTVLILDVEQTVKTCKCMNACHCSPLVLKSTLSLADLGGSEQLKKSKAEGAQLIETKNINLGLLSLKKVIHALNNNSRHVPYHDSKLTSILSRGLGGDCHTRIIVCANEDPSHADETLQTLRFGEECARIKNRKHSVGAILDVVIKKLRELDTSIEQLRGVIREKERWENVTIVREDMQFEAGTYEESLNAIGGERVTTSKLVGAEAEHKALEELLAQRSKLVGFSDPKTNATIVW